MNHRISAPVRAPRPWLASAVLLASSLIIAHGATAEAATPAKADSIMAETADAGSGGTSGKQACKKCRMGGMGGGHAKKGHEGHHPDGDHDGHDKKGHGRHEPGGGWKATLTDLQRQQLKALKVEHLKVVVPLKMKIKAIKADLAALVTADTVDQSAIEAKIDDLLWHKRLKLIEHYRYKREKRQLLTVEQRLDFDLKMMKRAKHGGKGRHGKHRRH